MIVEWFSQFGLLVFGLSAVACSQDINIKVRRWAPVLGLASEPFWLWTSYAHDQWGVFIISLVYLWAWGRGLRLYWWKA